MINKTKMKIASSLHNDFEATHDFPKSIGRPAQRALVAAGYQRLQDLTSVTEKELLNLHGFGPKALEILRQTLVEKGLTLKSSK